MELVKGQVVASRRGRDVTKWYVVVEVLAGRVALCDGDVRTMQNPKMKNPLHIAPTNTVFAEKDMQNDLTVKTALRAFEKGLPKKGG